MSEGRNGSTVIYFLGPGDREDSVAKTSLSNRFSIRCLGMSTGRFVWLLEPSPWCDLFIFLFPINLYTWAVLNGAVFHLPSKTVLRWGGGPIVNHVGFR